MTLETFVAPASSGGYSMPPGALKLLAATPGAKAVAGRHLNGGWFVRVFLSPDPADGIEDCWTHEMAVTMLPRWAS